MEKQKLIREATIDRMRSLLAGDGIFGMHRTIKDYATIVSYAREMVDNLGDSCNVLPMLDGFGSDDIMPGLVALKVAFGSEVITSHIPEIEAEATEIVAKMEHDDALCDALLDQLNDTL